VHAIRAIFLCSNKTFVLAYAGLTHISSRSLTPYSIYLSLSRTHTHSLSLSHPLSTHHLSLAHARVHTHTHPLSLYRARALSHTHSRTVTFSLAGALLLCTLLLCTLLLCTLLLCTLLLCTLLLYLHAVTLSLAAARDFVSLALFLAPWRCGRKCFGRGLG